MDAFSPEVCTDSLYITALRTAAEMRVFSPLLQDAFQAVSTTFVGRCTQDWRIESSGHHLYQHVLRSLQSALFHPQRSRSDEVLVVAILLGIVEVTLLFM